MVLIVKKDAPIKNEAFHLFELKEGEQSYGFVHGQKYI
jgi:hypothetical protein